MSAQHDVTEAEADQLIDYFDRIPQARAATRAGPVRNNVVVDETFDCEVCGIHTSDEQHCVTWRSRLGRHNSAHIRESHLHAARNHGADLPEPFATALSRLHQRYPDPER